MDARKNGPFKPKREAYAEIAVGSFVPPSPETLFQRLLFRAGSWIAARLGAMLVVPAASLVSGEAALEPVLRMAKRLHEAGVIERISLREPPPDVPRIYNFAAERGRGMSFFSKEAAMRAALAEAVERKIWQSATDYFKTPMTLTIGEAVSRGALDPRTLAGFSEEQRGRIPGLSFTNDSELLWIAGRSLTAKRAALIPAQLVSNAHFKNAVTERATEPRLRSVITTGLATAESYAGAVVRGLLEVIERDAFMISWLNELTLPRLDLEALGKEDARVRQVLASYRRYLLEPHAVLLATDLPVPIVCAVLIDRSGKAPAVTLGAKASFSLSDAVLGAFTEATAVHAFERRLMKMDLGKKEDLDQLGRLAWWSRPERIPDIRFFIDGKTEKAPRYEEATAALAGGGDPDEAKLGFLLKQLRSRGYDAFAVDMSGSRMNPIGLSVVHSIIPELQPLHLNERFPCLGGDRLSSVPESLGYQSRRSPFEEPHPFP